MNRRERRRLEREGKLPKAEPKYTVSPSQMASVVLNTTGKDSMKQQVKEYLLEQDKQYCIDMDTMVLWALRQFAGWGPKRLIEFYFFMFKEHMRMRKFYELDDLYPERYKLKAKGVDVEAMYLKLFDDEGNFKNPDEVSL